jgi:hypothetical protein
MSAIDGLSSAIDGLSSAIDGFLSAIDGSDKNYPQAARPRPSSVFVVGDRRLEAGVADILSSAIDG